MKKVLFSFVIAAAAAVMVSCGNKNAQNAEGQDSAVVAEEQTEAVVEETDPIKKEYPDLQFEPLKIDGKYYAMTVFAEEGKCGIELKWNKDDTMSAFLKTFKDGKFQRNYPVRVDIMDGSLDDVKKDNHKFTLDNIKEDKGDVEINGQKMWCFVGDAGNTYFIANSNVEPGKVVVLRANTSTYENSEEVKKSFDTFKIK